MTGTTARAIDRRASDEEASKGSSRELLEGAVLIARGAGALLDGLSDAAGISPRVRASPYGAVAASVGLGYVAGGGLFTPTTARIVGMALKLAAVPIVQERMLTVAESALDALLAPSDRSV